MHGWHSILTAAVRRGVGVLAADGDKTQHGRIVHRRIDPNCSMCDRPSSRSRLQICQFIDVTVSFIAKNECLVVPAACVGGWQGWEGSRVDIYE